MKPDIERRFFLAEGISHQPSDPIDKEIEWAAMARMLDLRDVFQLIVDSLAEAAEGVPAKDETASVTSEERYRISSSKFTPLANAAGGVIVKALVPRRHCRQYQR